MKRLHFLGLTCVCLGIAAVLLFRATTHAIAASPSSCGSWNVVPSPNNGTSFLYGVAAIAPNDIWAVGYAQPGNKIYSKTLIEHWDGTSWSIVPSPNVPATSNSLSGVAAVSATDIWAVGSVGKYGVSLIEHWNGTSWSLVTGPTSGGSLTLSSVAAVSATDIWAVGNGYADHQGGTLIEHWNGTKWSIETVGPVEAFLSGVVAVSATDVWAVGDGPFGPLIEHWNGTKWSGVKSSKLSNYSPLYGVAAVSSTNTWAVGGNLYNRALIEHWDGTKWSVVPSAPTKGSLQAIGVVSATDIWAVGHTHSNGITTTLTEHWDGSTWSVVPSPSPGDLNNSFNAVASIPGSNYVWAVGYAEYSTTRYGSSKTLTAYYC